MTHAEAQRILDEHIPGAWLCSARTGYTVQRRVWFWPWPVMLGTGATPEGALLDACVKVSP